VIVRSTTNATEHASPVITHRVCADEMQREGWEVATDAAEVPLAARLGATFEA